MDLPVRLVNIAEQVLESAPDAVSFTGKETFDETLAIAQETFAGREVTSIKLGRLHGVGMTNFSGMRMREYMRKNRLKPSATCLYAVCEEQAKKKPKKEKKHNERRTDSGSESSENREKHENTEDEKDSEENEDRKEKLAAHLVPMIDEQDIRKEEEIGSGTQARVYRGIWSGTDVALKETKLSSETIADALSHELQQEISLHAELRHPNILPLYGLCRCRTSVIMVTELMDGTLAQYTTSCLTGPDPLTCGEKVHIAKEIIKGVAYLHGKRVVHGDIKPPNVLISNDKKIVKLCDMGLSRIKLGAASSVTQSGPKGTYLYMAPELIKNEGRTSFASDMWTVGATLAEMFARKDFWKIPNKVSKLQATISSLMTKKVQPAAVQQLKKVNESLYDVISPCLSYDAEARPTADSLLMAFQQLK